jgi:hypothetical protein
MGALIGLLLLVALFGGVAWYQSWLSHGIRTRVLHSHLSEDHLRELFASKVASHGWHVEEPGNPLVAQSSLLAGIRQQVGLRFLPDGEAPTVVEVKPYRVVKKTFGFGAPTKAHTIRLRINAFIKAAQAADPQLIVRG